MSEYLIIRIRGCSQTKREVERTLSMLGLSRSHSACIVPESRKHVMQSIKDYVAYGEISDAFAKELKTLMNGNRYVNLPSPRKGFGSVKTAYPKGSLGNWGKDIEGLAKRMLPEKKEVKPKKAK
ncbi:50S ribosomal protein L30 [uncultured archaeon]|nr:50S ribosomal protein L30 [uncultured archaeon]